MFTEIRPILFKSKLPLARFKVLDLTRARAGPTAARQLADWGAQVLKIENRNGEDTPGPRLGYDFQNLHRNKRSITLDLKHPKGGEILKWLAKQADVLVVRMRAKSERLLPWGVGTMTVPRWGFMLSIAVYFS